MKWTRSLFAAAAVLWIAACSDGASLPSGVRSLAPTGPSRTAGDPFTGAIQTSKYDGSNQSCTVVNANLMADKQSVGLLGGPQNANAAGLPSAGPYFLKVTDPSGATILGKTPGATITAVPIDDQDESKGYKISCLQLWSVVYQTAPNGDFDTPQTQGYKDTPNGGGEYKVWLSLDEDYASQKTDNFKIRSSTCAGDCTNSAVDYTLTKSITGSGNIKAGSLLSFDIVVTSVGPGAITALSISDNLPFTTLQWTAVASDPNANCGAPAGVLTCSGVNLGAAGSGPNGTNPTFTVTVSATTTSASCGAYTNKASASVDLGGGPSALTNVSNQVGGTVTCPTASLTVTKTATTTYDRKWNWSISKSVDVKSATVQLNQQLPLTYTIGLSWSSAPTNAKVSGTITVSAAGNTAVTGVNVVDNVPAALGPNASATVSNCTDAASAAVSLPTTLAPGATITCQYLITGVAAGAVMGNQPAAVNQATATGTFDNAGTPTPLSGMSSAQDPNANISFSSTPANEIDKTVNLADTYVGPSSVTLTPAFPSSYTANGDAGNASWKGNVTVAYTSKTDCGKTPQITNDAAFSGAGTGHETATTDIAVQCQSIVLKKFYDANANGEFDGNDSWLTWKASLSGQSAVGYTLPASFAIATPNGTTLTSNFAVNSNYTATEAMPSQSNWTATTAKTFTKSIAANGGSITFTFGNVCTAGGNGKTRGFWSNTNGASVLAKVSASLVFSGFKLVDNNGATPSGASGTTQWGGGAVPTNTDISKFQSWIGSANAGSNLSYQLSAQAAAMYLNVYVGSPASGGWVAGVTLNKVDPSAMVYAPGTKSANSVGFAKVSELLVEVKAYLAANATVPPGSLSSALRTYGSALIAALDGANSNTSFVQASQCAATFP